MKILVDTNIWIKENLLRSPKGLSLTAFCYRNKHKILIPEIVEKEIEANFFLDAQESREKIKEEYRYLLATFGKLKQLVLPDDNEIKRVLKSRIGELDGIIERFPFSFEHAKSALAMIIEYLPPNSKGNQQFKDTAIWLAGLDAASNSEVAFITADNGFYKDKKIEKGLAENIAKDISASSNTISVYSGLEPFLAKHFKSDKMIDSQELALKIFRIEKERIENYVSEFNGAVQGVILTEVLKYVTGKDTVLSLDYKGEVEIEFGDTELRAPEYRIEGSCVYDISKNKIDQNFLNIFEFTWIDENGLPKEKRSTNVYGFGNIVSGHRTIEYEVKHKI